MGDECQRAANPNGIPTSLPCQGFPLPNLQSPPLREDSAASPHRLPLSNSAADLAREESPRFRTTDSANNPLFQVGPTSVEPNLAYPYKSLNGSYSDPMWLMHHSDGQPILGWEH